MQEPSPTAGEAEMLLFALERSRAQFAWKTGGLDAPALNRGFPPSAMTLGGLIEMRSAQTPAFGRGDRESTLSGQ
ncbi:hypothetical protein [Dactylosporangium sp. CA-233914]|uniref:hypothetical protein n=1 Tax=Dactylosporangium sp. CA-233914 TaxID=3239934 RepID=UPI003D8D7F4F